MSATSKVTKRRSSSSIATFRELQNDEPTLKYRRITRSVTRKADADARLDVFERVVGPVLSSGYLRWHEAESLSKATRGCRVVWNDQKETYPGWNVLLRELNSMNCTNKCSVCEQTILLKANRSYCKKNRWDFESAKRTPDLHGVIDLIMSSGVLTWREKGGVRRISKTCYKVHKEQCTCPPSKQSKHVIPFLRHDPRYLRDYEKMSVYKKCASLATYTEWMIKNLHSFYNFRRLTDASRLPQGLGEWSWFDIQMVTLQRGCPRRYSFVMNVVSLFIAQGELQRAPPNWYATAFLGKKFDPSRGGAYEECLGSGISEYCLPATDEVLCKFLRNKCYPSEQSQRIMGPLLKKVSIFAPFFRMVPLDESKDLRMPRSLELLNEEMIDSMSLHLLCTIS